MKKEPIRHHYIPQFILRNFAYDDDRRLARFCNKESQSISICEISEIFMERHLYRDEINHADAPTQIEFDLSVYEGEVARLIKSKFLHERKIELSAEEDRTLKLFFAIMPFRSATTKEKFREKMTEDSIDFYKYYQKNEDFEDFWKRNLGLLVKCRSLKDVENHPEIDPPIKRFMLRDTFGVIGKYFVVAEAREGDGFILGDCYPLVFTADLLRLPLYDVFPISPKRAIIMVSKGVDLVHPEVLTLRRGVFDLPEIKENGASVIVTKRLHLDEVQFLNREMARHSQKGFVFLNTNN